MSELEPRQQAVDIFSFLFKELFLSVSVFECRCLQKPEASDPLELEFLVVARHLM